jgi:hypothetical protein
MAFTKTAGVEYGTPAVVLSTTAASGSNQTAIRTDGQLIAFDTTVPESIGASNATGSAAVASRRDHQHAGVGAITSTDEAIARYNGTAGALQNYTSNAPTISDSGVITLTSGQLTFPATQNASANANTLSDFEVGTFSPTLHDNSNSDSEGQVYSMQVGRYQKVGRNVTIQLAMTVSDLGTLATGEIAKIAGLPYPSSAATNNYGSMYCGYGDSLALSSAGDNLGGYVEINASHISLRQWTATGGVLSFLISNYSVNGFVMVGATYEAAT